MKYIYIYMCVYVYMIWLSNFYLGSSLVVKSALLSEALVLISSNGALQKEWN
jgi:hypothetical protein